MKFQTPRGTRDFLPEEMIKRTFVLDTVRRVFEKWGFDPIETPAFEEWNLLAAKSGGGEAIKEEVYYFRDKSDRELGLRFDLTVPTARVVANNPDLPKPFRRYQIGPVWRYDRPGAGRYREFWQCDVDIFGSSSPEADAVTIATACDALRELGFNDFVVRINNRRIIEAFLNSISVRDAKSVFRSIDKLEKFGEKTVVEELKEKGIEKNSINKILDFIKINDLDKISDLLKNEKLGKEGVEEIRNILETIKNMGFGKNAKFDPSLVRGLDYYTSVVFEIVTKDSGLSIAGGGRYDNLIELFGGRPTPATGISLGIERIIEIMEKKGMFDLPKTGTTVFVANVSDPEDAMKIAEKLISLGTAAEFDVCGRNLSKQLEYVNSKGIPYTIVVGKKEMESRTIKLRDMKSGNEKEFPLDDVKKLAEYMVSQVRKPAR